MLAIGKLYAGSEEVGVVNYKSRYFVLYILLLYNDLVAYIFAVFFGFKPVQRTPAGTDF